MAKIDKYYGGIDYHSSYDYQDKERNVSNYVKYMFTRSVTMFHYTGLPETIPQEELEKLLQFNGYCCIAEVDGSLYALNGSLGGEGDAYNRPTTCTVANPALKLSKTFKIDEDCIIINSDSMYMGLTPLFEKYCTMLNESDITIILATINKRIQMLISANDDNTVESAKQFIKDIENGKLGVVAETKLFDSLKVNNTANNNNVNLKDLFEMNNYLKASMYNEIGLGSNNNMKREQLTVSEIESNTDSYYPLVDNMLMCRRKALDKINEMFGTDIQVEFNSSWDYRYKNGEPVDTLKDDEETETSEQPFEESEGVNNENGTKADIEQSENTTDNVEQSEEQQTVEPTEEPTERTDDEPVEEVADNENVENEEQDSEHSQLDDEPVETSGENEEPTETDNEPTDEPKEEPTETDSENTGDEKEEPAKEDEPVKENESEVEENGKETDNDKEDNKKKKDRK